jgi:hypothetical protein
MAMRGSWRRTPSYRHIHWPHRTNPRIWCPRTLYGGLVMSPEWTATMSTPVAERYGLGTFIVGDGRQGDLDFRLGGIGAIGHPGFLIPGYQALLLIVPDGRLHGSAHCRTEQCRHLRSPNYRRGPDRRPALVTAGHSRRT